MGNVQKLGHILHVVDERKRQRKEIDRDALLQMDSVWETR